MNRAGTVGGDARVRLFCALVLPDEVVQRVVEWQEDRGLADFGRPVPRENLHVTLAFLGSRPGREVDAIGAELGAAATAAGKVRLRIKRYRATRSVGMLVCDDIGGCAGDLAADLHARLHALGVYEPERRKWLPHVTVLRFREPPQWQPAPPPLDAFSPSDAAVYLSRLRPSGAEYVVVQKFGLGG